MNVTLTKNAVVNLSKSANDSGKKLEKVVLGAGWDAAVAGQKIDLDLLTVKLGADSKAIADANANGSNADEAVTFFGNLKTKGMEHSGDNLDGEGDGYDETITATLADVEAEVNEVAVVVISYSGQSFDQVANIQAGVVNADGNEDMATFTNSDLGSAKAVEMGRLKRANGEWSFTATGNAIETTGKEEELLKGVLSTYGVTGL